MFGSIFEGIGKELRQTGVDFKNSLNTSDNSNYTIVVAKPYCTPARNAITGIFQQYGVNVIKYNEYTKETNLKQYAKQQKLDMSLGNNDTKKSLPMAQVAEVTVSRKQARWGEYLLIRSGQFYRVGAYFDKRNEAWARKHNGTMPPQWDKGQPMIERTCKTAQRDWTDAVEQIKAELKQQKEHSK